KGPVTTVLNNHLDKVYAGIRGAPTEDFHNVICSSFPWVMFNSIVLQKLPWASVDVQRKLIIGLRI
ncbi:hypothetical protein STEG23_021676, partial [Scotinomys teguina]